ncbi:uncharacterized protein [Haliotis asinina]|uniref:uncharacterized protein n=1 Tax=Haliotis asinina TaxID=109174 RepID=UPI0035319EF2
MALKNIAIIVSMLNIKVDISQSATTTATTTTVTSTTTLTNCPEPLGVPNAYIVTSSPYAEGDLVTYRCYSGFTMTGVPSQTCGSSGTWVGNEPTCAPVDMSDTVNQHVNYTDTPFTMPEWSIILVCVVVGMILLLVCALIVAAICSMCRCKRCCSCEDVPERKAVTHVRTNSRVVTVSPAPEVTHEKPRLASIVQKVMENRSAKEVKTWMPHSNPVRPINTSTK